MKKKKDNDDWANLNDITKYITGVQPSNFKKRFLTTICSLIMVISLAVSSFFIALAMESAFNIGDFKQNIPEESIIIDMNNVPIYTSDENLRLPYFQEESKKQVFDLLVKESWWDAFFPTNITDYEFSYYQVNSNHQLDKTVIQNDGITKFDLKLKLKSSFIEFKIPVIALIKNTDKFYEKFMMFNQFEGSFSKHISGKTVIGGDNFPEQWTHGYLPHTFYYGQPIDNTKVYQTIQNQIDRFINDYEEEFATTTRLFPIISTNPLPDIDFNDKDTILPYFFLISNPDLFYVGNADNGSKQHVSISQYSLGLPPPPFYITYVSNPNIVYDLIALKPTTIEELTSYLTSNPLDFLPFSMVQKGEDDHDVFKKYTPEHALLVTDNSGNHFQYHELTQYFSFASSIKNEIEHININDYDKIGDLEKFLETKYWEGMRNFALKNNNFFSLHYPDQIKPIDPNKNWDLATNSLLAFKQYFARALDVPFSALTSFTFLDKDGKNLSLNAIDKIDANVVNIIEKIRFHVGQDLRTSDYDSWPHSFNFTFKVKWQ